MIGAALSLCAAWVGVPACFTPLDATCVLVSDLGQPYCTCKRDTGVESDTVSSCTDANFPNCCLDPTGSRDGSAACFCTKDANPCPAEWTPIDASNCFTGNTELGYASGGSSTGSGNTCTDYHFECAEGCNCGHQCVQILDVISECGVPCTSNGECLGKADPLTGEPYTRCFTLSEDYSGKCSY